MMVYTVKKNAVQSLQCIINTENRKIRKNLSARFLSVILEITYTLHIRMNMLSRYMYVYTGIYTYIYVYIYMYIYLPLHRQKGNRQNTILNLTKTSVKTKRLYNHERRITYSLKNYQWIRIFHNI
jgi:hypothetical protein